MEEIVLYEKKDKIAVLTVNRADALNALNKDVNLALLDCLDKADADDDVRVVILTGSGNRAFIAGADIKEMLPLSSPEARDHGLRSKRVADKLWNLGKPVIAMIDGFCLGGGLEYAMACDIRIASEKSKFGLPEITLGIIPGSAGTQRLPRLIGLTKAKELALTGEIFDAKLALDYGLVNHVVPSEALVEKTYALADRIAKNSAFSAKMVKTAMNKGTETDMETASLFEINCFALCFSTREQKDGMRAFVDKKKK
ncbi:MAG: enoyl-CoA hydratase/isomerase family protein [Syntrophaceae bacterium]|nr:enoyl-CoA hydratase/isomerase family protein [Syntrophaceae bacterium]